MAPTTKGMVVDLLILLEIPPVFEETNRRPAFDFSLNKRGKITVLLNTLQAMFWKIKVEFIERNSYYYTTQYTSEQRI